MNNIYFEHVAGIGKLYLEHVFYEFEGEPVLFVCADSAKKMYFCLCSEIRYEQKWIVARCGIPKLRSLIEENMDILSAFLTSPRVFAICMDLQGNETSRMMDIDDVDRLDLPKEGIYVRCNKEKARNYLWGKEWEMFSGQFERVTAEVATKETYSSDFNTSFGILNRRGGLYADSASKEFYERMEKWSEAIRKSMTLQQEHFVYSQGKYMKYADSTIMEEPEKDACLFAA